MPSVSKKQQAFMGAELARARAGKKTRTGMSPGQLSDFASTPTTNLPERSPAAPRGRGHKGTYGPSGTTRKSR